MKVRDLLYLAVMWMADIGCLPIVCAILLYVACAGVTRELMSKKTVMLFGITAVVLTGSFLTAFFRKRG